MHNRPSRARFCDSAVAKKEEYTIENFWERRLSRAPARKGGDRRRFKEVEIASEHCPGWSYGEKGFFKQAPLTLQEGSEGDLQSCPVLLVSAPGAVGKSTLAKRISCETGAVYIDLAKAEPVGGNSMTGGLSKSGLRETWEKGETAALIDGLDEAMLRATKDGFEAFLKDVIYCSKGREAPTVLFGRVGAVTETWALLGDKGMLDREIPILEIGYYGQLDATSFVMGCLDAELADKELGRVGPGVRGKVRESVGKLLGRWRGAESEEQDRFAGYAPALTAVARGLVQAHQEMQMQDYASKLAEEDAYISTEGISKQILVREQGKLRGIEQELRDTSLVGRLYTPEEQLDRLASKAYGLKEPKIDIEFKHEKDRKLYKDKLKIWLDEHPFLVDSAGGTKPINAVFEAVISVHALRGESEVDFTDIAEIKPNPFLSEFYFYSLKEANSGLEETGEDQLVFPVPTEHVGIIYDSIKARVSKDERASLEVGEGDGTDIEGEFCLERVGTNGGATRRITWAFEDTRGVTKTLFLGRDIEDADVEVPRMDVSVGAEGGLITLTTPVRIECRKLSIQASSVVVKARASKGGAEEESRVAQLYAETFDGGDQRAPSLTFHDAELAVSWPDPVYPWEGYEAPQIPEERREQMEEWMPSLRRLRTIVIAFKRRDKSWICPTNKIDGKRLTKGPGKKIIEHAIRKKMMAAHRDEGKSGIYTLDDKALEKLTGCRYLQFLKHQHYTDQALQFVMEAERASGV